MSRHEPRPSGVKVCSRCSQEKPVLAFSVAPDNRDGLQNICRSCVSAETAARSIVRKAKNAERYQL
jgi:hypothetical protein